MALCTKWKAILEDGHLAFWGIQLTSDELGTMAEGINLRNHSKSLRHTLSFNSNQVSGLVVSVKELHRLEGVGEGLKLNSPLYQNSD